MVKFGFPQGNVQRNKLCIQVMISYKGKITYCEFEAEGEIIRRNIRLARHSLYI